MRFKSYMQELLNNPLSQSGLIPFAVVFIFGLVGSFVHFNKGAALVILAFLLSSWLIIHGQLWPPTATRKIIMLGAGIWLLGFIIEHQRATLRLWQQQLIISALCLTAVLWVAWPWLLRQELHHAATVVSIAWIYGWWLVYSHTKMVTHVLPQSASLLMIALGTSIAITLSASASLGQLSGAIAAACGALWLLYLLRPAQQTGYYLGLPVGLLLALLSLAGFIYARLPWTVLIPLAFIPLVAEASMANDHSQFKSRLKDGLILLLKLTPICAISIYLAWNQSGESMF